VVCGSLLEERLVAAADIDSIAARLPTKPGLPASPDVFGESEAGSAFEATRISAVSQSETSPEIDILEEAEVVPNEPTQVIPADQMPAPWTMDAPPLPMPPANARPIMTPVVNAIPLVPPRAGAPLPATEALLQSPSPGVRPVALVTSAAPQPLGRACARCGTTNPPDYRFCGSCGAPLAQAVEPPGPRVRQPLAPGRASARVLRGERLGQILPLGMQATIGRGSCEVSFPRDPFLAAAHCTLVFELGRLIVKDEGGSSGTFVRIYEEENLAAGDLFAIGDHLLTFAGTLAVPVAAEDGTKLAGGPRPPPEAIKLEEIHEGLIPGRTVVRRGPSITLGRDDACEVVFPGDRFVSSRHCILTVGLTGRARIKDLGSTNGTFRRLPSGGERELFKGDCVRVGGEVLQFVES
jgi:pSer/pThr/pTyr-binding forkhead associated (FHA) protein